MTDAERQRIAAILMHSENEDERADAWIELERLDQEEVQRWVMEGPPPAPEWFYRAHGLQPKTPELPSPYHPAVDWRAVGEMFLLFSLPVAGIYALLAVARLFSIG